MDDMNKGYESKNPYIPHDSEEKNMPNGANATENNGYPYNNVGASQNNGTGYVWNGGAYSYSNTENVNASRTNGNGYYGASNNPYNPAGENSVNSIDVKIKPSKHKKTGIFIAVISGILCISILSAGLFVSTKKTHSKTGENSSGSKLTLNEAPKSETTNTQGTAKGALSAEQVYETVKDASVGVLVYDSKGTRSMGEGSGVLVSGDATGAYVLTCAHVVTVDSKYEPSNLKIKIQLHNGTQYDVSVVGYDVRTDLAVLRVNKSGLKTAEMGNSENLSVGETVYAIGNPGGTEFAGSFTSGMISSLARPVSSKIGYEKVCIQHTAAINPGNSGGALVNKYGQIVGINSSKIVSTDYEGMAFAVPSKTVKSVFDSISEKGYVTGRPKLGITYIAAEKNKSYSMLVNIKGLPKGSIVVDSVDTTSSLSDKDVQKGDIITKVNGKELANSDMLPSIIEKSKVGDKLTLTIVRFDTSYNAKEFEIEATLVEDVGKKISTEKEPEKEPEKQKKENSDFWSQFGY